MDVSLGFDGALKSQAWTPIAVRLSNTGGSQIDGVIHVLQKGSEWEVPTCGVKVTLPPNSKKCYHAYIRAAEYGEITVRFTSGIRTLAEERFPGNAAAETDRMIVSIGEKSARLAFLSGEKVPARHVSQYVRNPATEGTIHVGSIDPALLPDRPGAYDGVDVLVASNLAPSATDTRALQAISTWVASGGTLVIPTGANYKAYQNDFYSELLPVQLTGGVANVSNSLGISKSGGSGPSGAAALARSIEKPGICTSSRYSGGIPIVVRREYGEGCVIFLAFDPLAAPFRDWSGQTSFWKDIVNGSDPSRMIDSGIPEMQLSTNPSYFGVPPEPLSGLARAVSENPSVKSPSFDTIVVFMLAYFIVLIPVNYFVLQRKRRMELAWVTMPGIVIVFTVVGYGIGYTMNGGHIQLNQATVIRGSMDSRYASSLTCASIFSPARRTYSLRVEDPVTICRLSSENRDSFPAVYTDEATSLENIQMAMWSSREIESKSGIDLGGKIEGSLVRRSDCIIGVIRNNTAFDISNCRVFYNGDEQTGLGTLKRGESLKIDLKHGVGRVAAEQRSRFAAPYVAERAATAGSPILMGDIEGQKPIFSLDGRGAQGKTATLCVFTLNYVPEGTFTIPYNSIFTRVVSASGIQEERRPFDGHGELRSIFFKGGSMVTAYRLPWMGDSVITSLTVEAVGDGRVASPPKLALSLYNYRMGNWDSISSRKPVTDPDRYISDGNEVRLKAASRSNTSVRASLSLWATGRRR
jgi:hypothetical protein